MSPSTSDPLLSLLHQYASLQPLHQLELPPSLVLARSQDWIVDNVLLNPQLVRYPPDKRYRKGFLKILVARLEEGCSQAAEEEELEVLEPIYEAYVESMQSTSTEGSSSQAPAMTSAPGASYKTFFFPLPAPPETALPDEPAPQGLVTLREEQSIIQGGTTGLRTWIASLRLAEHLLSPSFVADSPEPSFPSRVIELGSGIGFLGSLVGKVMAHHHPRDGGQLVLTDFDERVLDGLKANIDLNEIPRSVSMTTERLDWFDALDSETRGEIIALRKRLQPELIIAADVAYDPVLGPPLIATLRLLLEPSSSRPATRALVATTIRIPATFDAFIDQARQAGMSVKDLALPSEEIFWGCGEGGVVETEVRLIELMVAASDRA